jgi:hypothetical protein
VSKPIDRSDLKPFIRSERQRHVFNALASYDWNIAKTAEALGVGRSTVRDIIQTVAMYSRLPEGQRLKGVTRLEDPSGNLLKQYVKSERERAEPEPMPLDFVVKRISLNTDGTGNVVSKWTIADKKAQDRFEQFWAACEAAAAKYAGTAEPLDAKFEPSADTVTVYPLGDPHIGMLAWRFETGADFDLAIATRELYAAVDMLVERAPASREAVLANVGDFFHAENDTQLTPRGGNKLDVDGRHAKVTELGFALYRRMVDRLLEKHDVVHVINVPGNHDPWMSRMLNIWLKAVYEKQPRVIIQDNRNPYTYLRFGKVLLGFAHGDGCKHEQLPGIMASDRPEDWGQARYRHWLTGHVHHVNGKEFPGCMVESFRTMAGRDSWHHGKGYRAGQSLSVITYDREYGELCRSTVDIRQVRAAA